MARPLKEGLDYFPFDVDFFSDIKVRRLIKGSGPTSSSILICLLCNIYQDKGYYIEWNKDLPFLIADTIGVSEGAVEEVIKKAIQVELFDENIYEQYNVLTSVGIQSRYIVVTERRKKIDWISEYVLIDVIKKEVDVNSNRVNVDNNPVNDNNSTQSKVKESICTNVHEETEVSPPPKTERVNYQEIINLYHQVCISYPQVKKLTDARKNKVRTRINELRKQFPDKDYLEILNILFAKMEASDFMRGNNRNNWQASFDWIFTNGANWVKVYEGNYDNKKSEQNEKEQPAIGAGISFR